MKFHGIVKLVLVSSLFGAGLGASVMAEAAETFSAKLSTLIEGRIGDYSNFSLKNEQYSLDNGSQYMGWVLHFTANLPANPASEDFSVVAVSVEGQEIQLMLLRKTEQFPSIGVGDAVSNVRQPCDVAIPLQYSYTNYNTWSSVDVGNAKVELVGSDQTISLK